MNEPTTAAQQSRQILDELMEKAARLPDADRAAIGQDIQRLRAALEETQRSYEQADRARQEVAARFQVFADISPLLIWMTDADGRLVFINKTYQEYFGATLETARTLDWQQVLHPEDSAAFIEASRVALRERKVFRCEARLRRQKDGEWRWFACYARPHFAADGAFLGHVGNGMNINERKQAEEALETSFHDLANERNRLLAVMEALPVGIAIVDTNGGLIQHNQGYDKIWGTPTPQASSVEDYEAFQAWWADSGEPVRPEEWASAQAVLKGETVLDQFLRIRRFNGQIAYTLNSAAPIRDANGDITGCAVAIRDITELVETENALRETRDRFRVALQSVPIVVFTCDRDLRYTWIHNPQHGLRAEDLLGKRDDEILPPANAAEVISAKQKALDTGQGGVQEVRVPLNGAITYHLLTTEPLRDARGSIIGLTCSSIDITAQKQQEVEQHEQAVRIEVQSRLMDQREEERNAIARDLHDGPIQNLSSTVFHLHMIKELFPDPALQPELERLGAGIKHTIQDLREVLNELRPPALMHFGLSKVIQRYAEDFSAQNPGIRLELDLMADDRALSSQARLALYRIFQAGIRNILRHSGASRVWIVYHLTPEGFTFELHDNGKGFALNNDLSRFTREGHFGLVGMKERAEAIGARLRIESEPGKGTKILVTGPARRE